MRRRGLLAAAALVVVANAIALLGVARNRASTLQTIELTERELTLGYQGEENSGIDLHLGINYEAAMDWFDAAKLEELGFPATVASVKPFLDWPARPAYVAFEYDGPTWQAIAAKERESRRVPISTIENQSQLVPVDVSRSAAVLLARYGATGRHLIVQVAVRPGTGFSEGKDVARGRITDLLGDQIHVPLPAALGLEKLPLSYLKPSEVPRYTVRLAYGTHFEPWVISVTALPR